MAVCHSLKSSWVPNSLLKAPVLLVLHLLQRLVTMNCYMLSVLPQMTSNFPSSFNPTVLEI